MRYGCLILFLMVLFLVQVGWAEETTPPDTTNKAEKKTFMMDAAKIEGKVESTKTPIPLHKELVPLDPLQPNPAILEKPLHVEQDQLLPSNRKRPPLANAIFWSTTAVGVGTGVAAITQRNHGESKAATTLAVISATSLLTSGFLYLLY